MDVRKDALGTVVEVGDIVFSAPRHKWSGGPTVGQVTGVFYPSGRVTMKYPVKVAIYAYQRGAPDIEKTGTRYVVDPTAPKDRWGYSGYEYTYVTKDYTVVDHEWRWVKNQAADITLIVLRKGGNDVKSLDEILNMGSLSDALNLDYDAPSPQLD